jgi:hypothetical protein
MVLGVWARAATLRVSNFEQIAIAKGFMLAGQRAIELEVTEPCCRY